MNDRTPRATRSRITTGRLRLVAPIAALALVLAGTTAAFASGAFESNDSGVDSAHDIAERGTAATSTPTSPTTTSLPDAVDDHGNDAAPGAVDAARTEAESTLVLPDGATQTFVVDVAGTVTIRRDGNTLSVVAANPNAGWVPEVEQSTGTEVEVNFENGTMRIDFNAELEDGSVRVRVRVRDDAADQPTQIDNSGPGSAVDNSGPGNVEDDHGTDDSGHDLVDDHSGHGGDGSGDDSGSGHSGSGRG